MKLSRLLILVLTFLSAGCGSRGPYETAPVSGRITVNGKPFAQVAITFQPVAVGSNYSPGPGSYGITDADGRYTLKLIGKETPGAVVGKHKVRFSNYENPGDPSDDGPRKRIKPAIEIPAKYNDREGKMEFDVVAPGTDSAHFQLTAP